MLGFSFKECEQRLFIRMWGSDRYLAAAYSNAIVVSWASLLFFMWCVTDLCNISTGQDGQCNFEFTYQQHLRPCSWKKFKWRLWWSARAYSCSGCRRGYRQCRGMYLPTYWFNLLSIKRLKTASVVQFGKDVYHAVYSQEFQSPLKWTFSNFPHHLWVWHLVNDYRGR